MNRPPLEVADLVRAAGRAFLERSRRWITWQHLKVLRAIARCRTAALGGHLDECTDCGYRPAISYNSCRDRHCPKCFQKRGFFNTHVGCRLGRRNHAKRYESGMGAVLNLCRADRTSVDPYRLIFAIVLSPAHDPSP